MPSPAPWPLWVRYGWSHGNSSTTGLFATDKTGTLQLVAREGAAIGTGPVLNLLQHQWQFKAVAAADFTNMSATDVTLTLSNIAAAQAGRYRLVATSSDGSTTSQEAAVTVAAAGAPLVKRIFIPGDPVPGFSDNAALSFEGQVAINNAGDIAYKGNAGMNDGSGSYGGTYFRSARGNYRFVQWQGYNVNLSDSTVLAQVIAHTGGTIDLGGGAVRNVASLTLPIGSGAEDGRRRSLNEAGEVVMAVGLRKAGTLAVDYSLFTARLAPDLTSFTAAYNTWAATAFPAGSGPEVTGPSADPDKDGNLNPVESLMGTVARITPPATSSV